MSEENTIKNTLSKADISYGVVFATLELAIPLTIISAFLLFIHILLCTIYKNINFLCYIHLAMFFLTQIGVLLLNYDKKLFKILLYETESTDTFDKTLNILWRKKIIPNKTIKDRLKGTARIIKYSIIFILCQLILLGVYLKYIIF